MASRGHAGSRRRATRRTAQVPALVAPVLSAEEQVAARGFVVTEYIVDEIVEGADARDVARALTARYASDVEPHAWTPDEVQETFNREMEVRGLLMDIKLDAHRTKYLLAARADSGVLRRLRDQQAPATGPIDPEVVRTIEAREKLRVAVNRMVGVQPAEQTEYVFKAAPHNDPAQSLAMFGGEPDYPLTSLPTLAAPEPEIIDAEVEDEG